MPLPRLRAPTVVRGGAGEERPALMDGAILEVLRWGGHGKSGGMPRYPLEEVERGALLLEKGCCVTSPLASAWSDPAYVGLVRPRVLV